MNPKWWPFKRLRISMIFGTSVHGLCCCRCNQFFSCKGNDFRPFDNQFWSFFTTLKKSNRHESLWQETDDILGKTHSKTQPSFKHISTFFYSQNWFLAQNYESIRILNVGMSVSIKIKMTKYGETKINLFDFID